ncbi:MAG: hypothetical protein CL534_08580 [Ahrensia sp.]|nr:hypothetical protein [Ahrensia sp.]
MIRRLLPAALLIGAAMPTAAAQEEIGRLSAPQLLDLAKATYKGDTCWWDRVEADIDQFNAWDLTFRYEYEKEDGPDRSARLYQMPCTYGAYNIGSIFFFQTEFEGLGPLHFAQPELDIEYGSDDDSVVEAIDVIGFHTAYAVINADYDPESQTITSFSKWRGIGDAFSSGTWNFIDGHFVLTRFDVDASYDGERTPQTVYGR